MAAKTHAPVILVTGANGQLGMELQDLAKQLSQYKFIFPSHTDLSIDDPEEINRVFRMHQPGFCINCAAYTAVDKAESEKAVAFRINADAVGILATACNVHHTQLIHISTDYVFDGLAKEPYRPMDPTNPVSVYGASKLEGERLALFSDPDSIIIRTSWVYSVYGKNFVKTMVRLMKEKDEINVVNDQFGSPTYAADLAFAIMTVIGKLSADKNPSVYAPEHPRIYHFSNEGIITWYEFALAIRDQLAAGCKVNPIPTSEYPTPAARPAWSVLDSSSFVDAFGLVPKKWKDALAACLAKLQ